MRANKGNHPAFKNETIPLCRVPPPPSPVHIWNRQAHKPPESPGVRVAFARKRQMRILVIDDTEDIRTIARLALSRFGGMEVLEAASGAEGVETACRERPDAILLDMMMPGLDGRGTLKRLRERPESASIPVIFLTSKVQLADLSPRDANETPGTQIGLQAQGVVPKPFNPLTLADEIRRMVQPLPLLTCITENAR